MKKRVLPPLPKTSEPNNIFMFETFEKTSDYRPFTNADQTHSKLANAYPQLIKVQCSLHLQQNK